MNCSSKNRGFEFVFSWWMTELCRTKDVFWHEIGIRFAATHRYMSWRNIPAGLACWLAITSVEPGAHADTIKTLDGKVFRGKTELTNGVLSITETNGSANTVALTNLEAAIFADVSDVIPGEHSLAPPWASQDVRTVGS